MAWAAVEPAPSRADQASAELDPAVTLALGLDRQ
jgi:hypothetical protein